MWLLLGLLRLISMLPFRVQLFIGRRLGDLLYVGSGTRRLITDTNLKRCLSDRSDAELHAIKRACYRNIGISMVEIAICWWWPEEDLIDMVEIEGQQHIENALQNGKAVMLLSGHFTSLEIGARLLALFTPLQVMYRQQKNLLFDSYLFTKRSTYFVNTVSRKNTRLLIKGLHQKIPTWYAPDQDFAREKNVFAPFFDIPAATITAGSRLAKASNAVMLPFYPRRKENDSGYVLTIGPPLQDFPSGDDVADATAINQAIERHVIDYPQNYMWVHKRFKTRPKGEPAFYPRPS